MWLMLQHDKPEDFVIATGEVHSVRELVELAFKEIGVNIVWVLELDVTLYYVVVLYYVCSCAVLCSCVYKRSCLFVIKNCPRM